MLNIEEKVHKNVSDHKLLHNIWKKKTEEKKKEKKVMSILFIFWDIYGFHYMEFSGSGNDACSISQSSLPAPGLKLFDELW